MPIPATIPHVSYISEAGQTLFPYPWRIALASHLTVYASEQLMTLGVQYDVTGVGNAGGGNVVSLIPVLAGASIIILSHVPLDQQLGLQEHGPFPALSINDAFDKSVRLDQQLQEQINRSLKLAPTSLIGPVTLPEPASITTSAGGKRALVWNDAGTDLALVELIMQSGLVGDVIPITTSAGLGVAGSTGRIRYVSDLHTLAVDQGGQWHLFTSIEESVIPATTRALLPSPTTIAGQARFLTDAPKSMALSDGTAWLEFPVGGVAVVTGYAFNSLPTPTPAGQLARISDSVRGLALANGTNWVAVNAPVYRPEDYPGANFGARLNACIAAMPAGGGTIDCRSFNGNQTATSTILITKPITLMLGEVNLSSTANPIIKTTNGPIVIEGISRNLTQLLQLNPTQTAISHETSAPVRIEHLSIVNISAAATSGAGIWFPGDGVGNGTSAPRIHDVTISNQWTGIGFINAAQFVVSDSYIVESRQTGIYVAFVLAPDAGDSLIIGNTFDTTHNEVNTAAIMQVSSGGLKIIGNKILSHYYGIVLDIQATTVILLIEANSIENQYGACIALGRSAGTATFSTVIVNGNQMTAPYSGAVGVSSDAIADVVISNNVIGFVSPHTAINLIAVSRAMVQGNLLVSNGGTSVGVNVAAGALAVCVGQSAYFGVTNPVQYGPTTIPTTMNHLPAFTTAQRDALAGIGNGCMIYNLSTGKAQVLAGGVWVDLH